MSTSADELSPLLADERPALRRLPRRGVGTAGHHRAGDVRAALSRGLPVGALVAHDPAQARELSRAPSPASTRMRSHGSASGTWTRLLGDAGIVRHRGKIEATIVNARGVARAARGRHAAARARLGRTARAPRPPQTTGDWHAQTPESKELSKRLSRPASASSARRPCGRRCRPAVSSTTISPTCYVRDDVEREIVR